MTNEIPGPRLSLRPTEAAEAPGIGNMTEMNMDEHKDKVLRLPADTGRLMSEQEAVEYLGLLARPKPKAALRWLMRARRLAFIRLGKGIYGFRRSDLDAFIAARRVPAGVCS